MTAFSSARIARDWLALTELGPRFPGTPGEAGAFDYVVQAAKSLACETELHPYTYLGWEILTKPKLAITAPEPTELECYAFVRCAPTGPAGVRGCLVPVGTHQVIGLYRWEKFAIVDETGGIRGYVSARPDGNAQPQPLSEGSSLLPHFAVGRNELAQIWKMLEKGHTVWVDGQIDCRWHEGATARNIVATVAGRSSPGCAIVLCAHLDSIYGCPGANDNAGGAAVLLELLRYYSVQPLDDYSLRFIFFNGEEWNLDGSKAYVADLAARGELTALKAVVNLDGVAETGQQIQFWAGPEELEWDLRGWLAARLDNGGRQISYMFPPSPGSDHWPFWQQGVPVLMATGWEMEKYHLEADTCTEEGVANLVSVTGMTRYIVEKIAVWEAKTPRIEHRVDVRNTGLAS